MSTYDAGILLLSLDFSYDVNFISICRLTNGSEFNVKLVWNISRMSNVIDPQNYGSDNISGIISPDMKVVSLGEYGEGLIIGQIIDTGHMEFIYLENGEWGSTAIDTLTREES